MIRVLRNVLRIAAVLLAVMASCIRAHVSSGSIRVGRSQRSTCNNHEDRADAILHLIPRFVHLSECAKSENCPEDADSALSRMGRNSMSRASLSRSHSLRSNLASFDNSEAFESTCNSDRHAPLSLFKGFSGRHKTVRLPLHRAPA